MVKNDSFLEKNKNILSISLILVVVLLLLLVIGKSFALGEIATGTSGDCDWSISSEGVLNINTENSECTLDAAVEDNGIYKMPWYDYLDKITSVSISQVVKANSDSSYLFSNLTKVPELDLRDFDMAAVTDYDHMFENLGNDLKEGTTLILNDTFTGDYSNDSGYYLPYKYYAYMDGEKLSDLHTLSQMKDKILEGGIFKWVPAYKITFNPNSTSEKVAKIIEPGEDIDTYIDSKEFVVRIGSYIDATDIETVRKNDVLTKWTDTKNGDSPNITVMSGNKSENTYCDNYVYIGTNNVITLYAQYDEEALTQDVVFLKKDNSTNAPIKGARFSLNGHQNNFQSGDSCIKMEAISDMTGKVIFKSVPTGKYKLIEINPAPDYEMNSDDFIVTVGVDEGGSWNECN